jgi:hypothetical protein
MYVRGGGAFLFVVVVAACRSKRLGQFVSEREASRLPRERSVKEETRKERRFLFAKSGIG